MTPPAPASAAELTTFANDVHGYLRQNITWADQKAAFVFAAASGFIAYLNSKSAFEVFKGTEPFASHHLVLIVASVCIVLSAIAAFATIWPHTKGSSAGLVFWGAIAKNASPGAYVDRVKDKTAEELAAAKLDHAFELAKICERKFRWVDAGVRFGIAGFGAAMVYALVWL
jgi:Pycsar effector protein